MNPNSNPPVDLNQLGTMESRMSRGIPATIHDWERACESLCAWEKDHLCAESTDEELTQHERWLDDMLAWGCEIAKITSRPDFPDRALAGSVQQRVDHLDDKYAVWHAGMTSEDEPRVIDAAYD